MFVTSGRINCTKSRLNLQDKLCVLFLEQQFQFGVKKRRRRVELTQTTRGSKRINNTQGFSVIKAIYCHQFLQHPLQLRIKKSLSNGTRTATTHEANKQSIRLVCENDNDICCHFAESESIYGTKSSLSLQDKLCVKFLQPQFLFRVKKRRKRRVDELELKQAARGSKLINNTQSFSVIETFIVISFYSTHFN